MTINLSAAVLDDGILCLAQQHPGTYRPTRASEGLPETIGGMPCFYSWKDVISVGNFTHPSENFKVDVDGDRLNHWLSTFDRMQANGVKVFIPDDHSRKAADNNGHVVRLRRNGDTLEALCQFIGESAALKAARNEVSVGIHPNLKDGRGNVYPDALEHVALTPTPVVNRQCHFLKAASLSGAPVEQPEPDETNREQRARLAKERAAETMRKHLGAPVPQPAATTEAAKMFRKYLTR